jgi:hypothetical protein
MKSALSALYLAAGPTGFSTVHNDLPFGRAHAPPPYAAALFQEWFKNRKLMRHCDRSLVRLVLCRSISSQVQGLQQIPQNSMKSDDLIGFCLHPELPAQRRAWSCMWSILTNLKLKTVGGPLSGDLTF